MGCTLNLTNEDYQQMMQSMANHSVAFETLEKAGTDQVRAALHQATSERLLSVLMRPENPAYGAVAKMLAIAVDGKEMTLAEFEKLPEAFTVILKDHRDAMGIFTKASLRGPGASPVHHPYEIFSAAALKVETYKSETGRNLTIHSTDRVDFGIKFPRTYFQPRKHGTIEADILIHRGALIQEKLIGIDSKFSKTGEYGIKDRKDLQRQLDGIRTNFRAGNLHEYWFVTNRAFSPAFRNMVTAENLEIARDYAERHNRFYHDERHGIRREDLTPEERENIPPGKVPASIFKVDNPQFRKFVEKYEIQQIDLCENVRYPGT